LQVEDSLKQIEGLNLKIQDSLHSLNKASNAKGIVDEVEQARKILEDITHTFHLIQTSSEQSNIVPKKENSPKDTQKSIGQYEKAKTNDKIPETKFKKI